MQYTLHVFYQIKDTIIITLPLVEVQSKQEQKLSQEHNMGNLKYQLVKVLH